VKLSSEKSGDLDVKADFSRLRKEWIHLTRAALPEDANTSPA